MNLRTFLSASLFLILLLASCNKKEEKQHALPAPMEEIDTTSIKKSLLREIKTFVGEHDNINAFILYSMQIAKIEKQLNKDLGASRKQFNELFCICTAQEFQFNKGEFVLRRNYPHRYINLDGKIIFVTSDNDVFYDQEKLKGIYDSIVPSDKSKETVEHHFFIYDLKDSCESMPIPYPYEKDSIYDYEHKDLLPSEKVEI